MKDLLKGLVGRIVGAAVGAVSGLAAAKGLGEISVPAQSEVVAIIANAFMLIGYALAHKLFDRQK